MFGFSLRRSEPAEPVRDASCGPARVLIVIASPHNGGSTYACADILREAALGAGAEVRVTALRDQSLHECYHCGACRPFPHRCRRADDDDTEEIFASMRQADLVLWAQPIYFYGIPARAKMLIDRAQRFWRADGTQDIGQENGPDPSCRRGLAVPVLLGARTQGENLFAGSGRVLRLFFRTIGLVPAEGRELRGIETAADLGAGTAQELASWCADLVRSLPGRR